MVLIKKIVWIKLAFSTLKVIRIKLAFTNNKRIKLVKEIKLKWVKIFYTKKYEFHENT